MPSPAGPADGPDPSLHGGPPRGRPPTSAILLLHGGKEDSSRPTARAQLAYVRMLDLFAGLRHASRHSAVYLLRYRVRGWNAQLGRPSPVGDARWALDAIAWRCGDVPVTLLGHSMGGRTAFRVAAHESVRGICALAPWLPAGEPLPRTLDGRRFVLAHGGADTVTSPLLSLEYARRLRAAGGLTARYELAGARHSLLDRPVLWHRFAVQTTLGLADDRALPPGVEDALRDDLDDSLRLPLGGFAG